MTSIYQKVLLRAFRSHWDCENQWRIDGDMAEWSLWHYLLSWFELCWEVILICGILWRYSCSFSPAFCKLSSGSHVSSPWMYPFHLTRYSFFPCCKGISLGQCLVTWVGSHLRAVISLIAFPRLSYFPFCDNPCDSSNSIIRQYVNICQVPWEWCLDNLVV